MGLAAPNSYLCSVYQGAYWNEDKTKAQLAIVRPMLGGSLMDHSVLTQSFKLQDGYALVPVSSIEQTTLCVPQDFGPKTEINDLFKPFLWVLPTSDWAAKFAEAARSK